MQNMFFANFLSLSEWGSVAAIVVLALMFGVMWYLETKKIDFSWRMAVALVLGAALGIGIQAVAGFPSQETIKNTLWINQTVTWYGLFTNGFTGFIRMLVIPIIMASMIRVIYRMERGVNMGKLTQRTLFWLLFTTGIAAAVGIVLSRITDLGSNIAVSQGTASVREVKNIVQVLLGIIPSNPVAAMAGENVIAVVIFASFIGSSARIMASKEKYAPVMKVFGDLVEASYRIVMSIAMTVIRFMPYAVVAMIARVLISYGLGAIAEAGLFIALIYGAVLVMLVIYAIIILLHGLNPLPFFKKSLPAWMMAFSSRSSVGTLPMTISTLENRLGVNTGTANFAASLGSTAGMNGCAGFFPAMVAVMIARIVGAPLDVNFYLLVVVVAVLGSLGIAGIPGVATMAASIMLSGIGFSQHFGLLALVLAIDPIIDMGRTMINVAGSMVSALVVDKELGTLNIEQYNSEKVQEE